MSHGLIVCLEHKVTIHGGNLLGSHNNGKHKNQDRNEVYIGHEHELRRISCPVCQGQSLTCKACRGTGMIFCSHKVVPATEAELAEAIRKREAA